MRVIAGTLKRRTLHAPEGRDTRPTHDRVREALFSVLGNVTDAKVLDLCAGTGALGIEALSRGARHAVFVEKSREAFRCLTRNIEELDLGGQSLLLCQSVEGSRARLLTQAPFDFIFCDPPWAQVPIMVKTLGRLNVAGLLAQGGLLILEHAAKLPASDITLSHLCPLERRTWGDTGVTLFAHEAIAPAGD